LTVVVVVDDESRRGELSTVGTLVLRAANEEALSLAIDCFSRERAERNGLLSAFSGRRSGSFELRRERADWNSLEVGSVVDGCFE
jgi:hypothetical protein